jgi:hypothetical protein
MPPTELYIENLYIIYELTDGVLYATFKPGIIVDLSGARLILSDRLKFVHKQDLPILIDVRGLKSITKEARDFLSSEDGQRGVKASAMLIEGYLSSTIANFFLKVNVKKNKFPVKTFTDRTRALTWLQQYK